MLEQLLQRIRANDPTLTTIDLYRKNIGAAGAQAMAEALKTNTSVKSIYLGGNNIGNVLPSGLRAVDSMFKWMGIVKDSGTQSLAEALKANTSITTIDLSCNEIGDSGAQALAEVLKTNTSMTEIVLQGNNIGAAGAQALADALKVNTSLTLINLWRNTIGSAGAQSLAEALKMNTSITTIDLTGNEIGDSGLKSLAEALKINTSVTTINLHNNNLGDAGAQALAEAIKVNSTLTGVGLGCNYIRAAGAKALAEALKVNSAVEWINLNSNNIGNVLPSGLGNVDSMFKWMGIVKDSGTQSLAEALKVNTTLTTIYLASNNIGDDGAQALADALKFNNSLTAIDLSQNNIGAAGSQALAEALKVNTTVAEIYLSNNTIGVLWAQTEKQIDDYLRRNRFETILQRIRANDPTLATVDLRNKAIGDAGAQALVDAIKVNTTVTEIYLPDNTIGAVWARAEKQIDHYLRRNRFEKVLQRIRANDPTLTTIDWRNNNIGAAVAQALAKALKVNTTVEKIDLGENNIEDAGAQALADALKVNTSLWEISLDFNNIEDAGVQALAEMLKVNTALIIINLSGNEIGDAGAQALAEALEVNTTVANMDLSENNIEDAGAQALAEALKVNTTVANMDLSENNIEDDAEVEINEYLNRNMANLDKLFDSAKNNDVTTVRQLLAAGITLAGSDKEGKSALYYAIELANFEILYLILNSTQFARNRAAIFWVTQYKDQHGNTLLHQAVLFAENNPEISHKLIERLLAFGAKRYVKNDAGQYPFQLFIPATTEENPELAIIRNLLKPNPAEQLFIDHIVNNPHIKPLIEKLSKTLVAMDELMVTLRSDKTKQKYQLPGDLVVRLLFEELQQFRTHIEQDDFDCEEKSAWKQFLATCLSNYENMTNNLSASQISREPEVLTDNESQLLKELILKLQQMNQAIFAGLQGSTHRDEMIQEVCIPREWVKEYELSLAETQTNKKRKRETEDLNADEIATADAAEELSAKRQKTDDFSVEDLEKKIRKLEQNLLLSQTEITELKQKLAKAETAKQSENTRTHSVAFFPTLQK